MIKKIAYLGVFSLLILSIISCEEDIKDIGGNIINNNAFSANELELELEITTTSLESVRADNIAIGNLGEYLLGVYNNPYGQKIEASVVSQVATIINPKTVQGKTTDELDSTYTLDKVMLKLPYPATKKGKESDGKPKFEIDSILGNTSVPTSLKVYRNGTYLNRLDPKNPSKSNIYQSNFKYLPEEELTEDSNFAFVPKATDTMYVIERKLSTGKVYKDTLKHITAANSKKAERPFLMIPLKTQRMKELFWDEFAGTNFSSKESFDNYFRGLIIKAEGNDGSLVPFNFSNAKAVPTLEFYYTITIKNKTTGEIKDPVANSYSFSLSGIRNSIYKMSAAQKPVPSNSFSTQGTAGTIADIKILGVNLQKLENEKPKHSLLKYKSNDANNDGYLDLKELFETRKAGNSFLINDATLILNVNTSSSDTKVPQKLLLYKRNEDNIDIQLPDSYTSTSFGGNLELKDKKPEKYTIRITDYLSGVLSGKSTINNNELKLKVYNFNTDAAIKNKTLDTIVKTYNWNPMAVTLFNHSASNNDKKAVLKVSYTEEK